jgi:microsomal dipeptidase-like Zn-dependent dipeptidase
MMNDYADLRDVVENLARRGMSEQALGGVLVGNYARIVKGAMAQAART